MSDPRNQIPSFDEVMGKETVNGKIPSFADIMGDDHVKKKEPVAASFGSGKSLVESLFYSSQSGGVKDVVVEEDDDPVKTVVTPYKKAADEALNLYNESGLRGRNVSESTKQANYGDRMQINARADFEKNVKRGFEVNAEQLNRKTNEVIEKILPNGKVAIEYLQKKAVNGELPKNNQTVNIALDKANNYSYLEDKINNSANILELAVDVARESNPHLDKQIKVLEGGDAARMRSALTSGDVNVYATTLPGVMQGRIAHNFLKDKDVALIMQDNPEKKAQYDYLVNGGIYEEFPEYGENEVRNRLSREYEKRRANIIANPIFNKSKYLNNLADELFANEPQLKKIADGMKGNWEGKITTTGIADDFGTGAKHSFGEMFESAKDVVGLGDTEEERTKKGLEQQYGAVESGATGWRKDVGNVSNFLGVMGAMGVGGAGTRLLKMSPSAANATVTGLTFYNEEKNKGTMNFPGEPEKADAYAALSTWAFMQSNKLFPSMQVANKIAAKMQPTIKQALANMEGGVISKEAEKNIAKKYFDIAKETVGKSGEGALHMMGLTGIQDVVTQAMGGQATTSEEYVDVGRNMILGLGLPKLIAAAGSKKAVAESLNSVGTFPERYKSVLEQMKMDDPEMESQVAKKLEDIDYLSKLKQQATEEGVPEKNHGAFMLNAMGEKYANERVKKGVEPTIEKKEKEKIKDFQETKERILAGEDPETIVTEREQKIIDEQEKAATELERLEVDKKLAIEKVDAKIEETDGRESEANRIKLKELKEEKRRINEDYEKKAAKLQPKEPIADLGFDPETNEATSKAEPQSPSSSNTPQGGEIFYTGRKGKVEDFSTTRGDFIFFSKNKETSEWYGGDESNVTEAKINTSKFVDLSTQEKKAEFVKENFTDEDIQKLYPELKTRAFDDRDVRKTYEQKLQELTDQYRERLQENRFSGDNKEQKFLLNKVKEKGHTGAILQDTFFGKNDMSYVVVDKSAINPKESSSNTPKEEVVSNTKEQVGSGGQGESGKSILESEVDLLGNEKPKWALTNEADFKKWYDKQPVSEKNKIEIVTARDKQGQLTQSQREQISKHGSAKMQKISHEDMRQRFIPTYVAEAIGNGEIKKAISEGKLTANDAKTIIESAGLEVPKNILEQTTPSNLPKGKEQKTEIPKPISTEKSSQPKDEPNQTGEPPKEPPTGAKSGIRAEQPEMSFKKDNFVRARNRVGIDEFVDEGKTTHLEESTKAQRTIEKWKEDGDYAENMADIQERASKGQINNQEKFIFAKHLADLDATVNAIKDVNSKEYDKALIEYNKALNAADAARSEAGRQLGMIPKNRGAAQSLADVMVDMMGDKGVDVLTPGQKIIAEKRYNDVKTALDKEAALRIEAENKIKELEAENAILKAKRESAKNPPKKNKTAEDYKSERAALRKSIKEKWNSVGKDNTLSSDIPYRKQLAAIAPDVAKLIRSYVDQNAKIALAEVRKLIKKDLEEDGIKITDEDVREIIAGNFEKKKHTKNELSAQVYDLRREEKLLLELDALESGKEPTTEKGKQLRNQRLKDIRDKIDAIKKQNGIGKYSDENRFVSTVKQRIAANKKIQTELQDKINKGDYADQPQNQSILENAQFKQKYSKLYKEYEQSIIEKDKKAFEYEQKRINDKIKNYGWVEKFGHGVSVALHTSKGAVAIFDQSGLLVQLIQTTFSHPWETAKNILPALRDIVTNKWFDANMAKLKTSKYWDIMEKMEVPLYDTHSHDINFRNDLLGGDKNLLNKDITIGEKKDSDGKIISKGKKFSIGKAFERSTATLFNNIRVKLAIEKIDQLYTEGKTWETAPEEFKAAGRVIAEFTGHGKVAKSFTNENWNLIIWSAKMMASTFNTLGLGDAIRPVPTARTINNDLANTKFGKAVGLRERAIDPKRSKGFYSSLTPQQRKFAAKEMGRFILSGATVMAAAYAKGRFLDDDDDKKTVVDANPLSTDFGTIKIGDKTVNVFGRYSATVGGVAQIIMGMRYLGGDKKDVLGDKFGDKTAGDVAFGKFARGKMTPIAGLLYDYQFNNKKNYFTKEEIAPLTALKQVIVPLAWQDLAKDIQREDPALKTALWTMFKIYGGNVRDAIDFPQKESKTGAIKTTDAQGNPIKRDRTQEEEKNYQQKGEEKFNAEMERLKGQTIYTDKYGDIVVERETEEDGTPSLDFKMPEGATAIQFENLNPEQKKQLETKIKRQTKNWAKKELFGQEQDDD